MFAFILRKSNFFNSLQFRIICVISVVLLGFSIVMILPLFPAAKDFIYLEKTMYIKGISTYLQRFITLEYNYYQNRNELDEEHILKTIQDILEPVDFLRIITPVYVVFDSRKNILLTPPEDQDWDFCSSCENGGSVGQGVQEEDCCDRFIKKAIRDIKTDDILTSKVETRREENNVEVYTMYFEKLDWYISIVWPSSFFNAIITTALCVLSVVIFVIFILGLVLSNCLVRRVIRPLKILAAQIERVPELDFIEGDHRELLDNLPVSHNNEIGRLARSCGFMVAELSANIKQLLETTASKERMEKELSVARDIQLGSLPTDFSFDGKHEEVELNAFLVPAREIGGDLYDFFFVDDDHLCFTVGDVAGKGVPAALFMVIAKKLISNNAHHTRKGGYLSPAEIMSRINKMLCRDNPSATFITLFIGILNVKTGQLRYANGGHVPPVFTSCGSAPYYKKELSGPVVGVIPGITYKDIVVPLEPGAAVFLCTDGVTEAMDEEDKLFGDKRLLEDFTRIQDGTCKEVIDGILHEVKIHAGNAPQSDDIAMMMIRWVGKNEVPEH
ncbi:MAG: SpoIIE family protein phosphatase [Planctomycetes bacterium]|nr:SpoIIE family protein phosphatase [Planctomycetota bacterium]